LENWDFREFATYLLIMDLRSRPLQADLMSALSLGKFNYLSVELHLHTAISNLCRFPTTSRGDTQRQAQQPSKS